MEEWHEVLDELIWLFEQVSDDKQYFQVSEDPERYDNAWKLFYENYRSLWW